MRLYEKPFNSGFVHAVFAVGSALKYPQFWIVNKFLSYLRETTAEREWRMHEGPCYERGCIIMLAVVFGLIAMVLLLPFTIIGYFLWLVSLRFRNPFLYLTSNGKSGDTPAPLLAAGRQVSILSLNTKLLPESRARTFNLSHVGRRATQIASVIVQASVSGFNQGKNSGEPSYAGKASFALGMLGDSVSQASYGYLEKSVAYGDNFSENRSLVSGAAVDVVVSGPQSATNAIIPNGDSFSVGGGTPGQHLAADQITVTSLKSVEGMWQRRTASQEKTDSCITLKSDVPLKLMAMGGLPGSSHTLESYNSESRSRISEPNPSTMSLSSRVQGIPAITQNGSIVVSSGNGSVSDQARQQRPSLQPASRQASDAADVEQPTDPSQQSQSHLAVQPQRVGGSSNHSSSVEASAPQNSVAVAADVPSLGPAASVAFSNVVTIPSDCPVCDIVCLQEVSDSRADEIVASRLITAFPHVLHSAKRYHGFRSCPVTVGNLLIASKFPILSARYHEQLTSFGKRSLLVAKLLLHHLGDQRVVAIVGNVYLKRNSSLTMLEPGDFDDIVKWLRCFRNDAISMDANDILGLDVCSGYLDLPEDGGLVAEIFQHEFFMSYVPPSMNMSNELFGAELEPAVVHDTEVNQPESLNRTLFRYHPTGPRLSQLFRRLSDVAGETAPFALMKSSFLRYCQDTPDNAASSQQGQSQKQVQWQANTSRGKVTTAFAGITTHLGLNASFQN